MVFNQFDIWGGGRVSLVEICVCKDCVFVAAALLAAAAVCYPPPERERDINELQEKRYFMGECGAHLPHTLHSPCRFLY